MCGRDRETDGGREGAEVGYNVPFFLRIIAEYVAGILDGGVLPLGSRFILWTKVILFKIHVDLSLIIFWSVYYLDDWLDHAMVLDSAMKWDEKRQTPARAMQKKGATFFVFVGVVKNSVRLALRNSLRAKRASERAVEKRNTKIVRPFFRPMSSMKLY